MIEGFWAELRLRQPTHHISGQQKFKLGHMSAWHQKICYVLMFSIIYHSFYILLGQIRLSWDGGGFSGCLALPIHILVDEEYVNWLA